jgi:hypothetical protein
MANLLAQSKNSQQCQPGHYLGIDWNHCDRELILTHLDPIIAHS